MDQYNPIRNTVSLGSKAYSDLRHLTTRQYLNIEACCSSDSRIPSFDTPPPPLPEYQRAGHCYSPYAINFNLRVVVNHSESGHTEPADERAGREA